MSAPTITVKEAKRLEESFLGGLNEVQDAYEQIVEARAWTVLGYDTFTEWWQDRVVPLMRQLSMSTNRELAAQVVEQVRADEAELPPLQRRTQAELADLAGVSQPTVGKILGTRANPLKKDGAWRSTKGNYAIAHQRVKKLRGAATDHRCSSCGSPAAAWAYDHSDPDEFWEIVNGRRVPWSGDPDHYQAMCRPCHNKLDRDYAAHRNNQDRLQGNGSSGTDLDIAKPAACESCGSELDEQNAEVGYLRCEGCDSEGDHVASTFPKSADGLCVVCHPDDPQVRAWLESTRPENVYGKYYDPDKHGVADPAPEPSQAGERERPPRMSPAERQEHEESVRRTQAIAQARRASESIVHDLRVAMVTIVTGCRYGETGLITKDMIRELREVIDQLEGEL